MTAFIYRPVVIVDLPLAEGLEILHPQQVILRFAGRTVDVGALCYLQRSHKQRETSKKGKLVEPLSFDVGRSIKIRALIEYFSSECANTGRRLLTLSHRFGLFSSSFMYWADNSGHADVLDNIPSGRAAFHDYVIYLKERVSQNKITLNSAAHLQLIVLDILGGFLNIDDLMQGVNLIRQNPQSIEATKPPCEVNQSKVLALCESIFHGLTDLVLLGKPFPYSMKMPHYLGWEQNSIWVFPLVKWCMAPHEISGVHKVNSKNRAYDFKNGRLALPCEISLFYHSERLAEAGLESANKRILAANADLRDFARYRLAIFAHNAFFMLFLANTGMNRIQAFDMPWAGVYKSNVERQGFRVVKWRAGGRNCFFEITSAFLPNFKRFLLLREYLLNGMPYEYLFFSLGQNIKYAPKRLGRDVLFNFHQTLLRIDPMLSAITAREWRAAKSDWLIRNVDTATAAVILQNTEKTVLKHYAAGSETKHMEEMSSFLNSVAETVIKKGTSVNNGTERSVGVCSKYNDPHQLRDDVPIIPDCRTPEGCLFCDKFRVHADERDTRKLISCRYCLQHSSQLALNEEHYKQLFSPLFDRIQQLVDEIARRGDGEMVARIVREVEEDGELDKYWAGKLEMLMELDLVS